MDVAEVEAVAAGDVVQKEHPNQSFPQWTAQPCLLAECIVKTLFVCGESARQNCVEVNGQKVTLLNHNAVVHNEIKNVDQRETVRA